MATPTKNQYKKMVEEKSPNSRMGKNLLCAYLIGGGICVLGQLLFTLYHQLELDEKTGYCLVSVTLVALSALLTGLRIYDNIAKVAGAGTLVPITGFANAVVSSAIEFKSEGFILGVGAKMFTIAGPVIVYGVSASVVYGLIYWITTLF